MKAVTVLVLLLVIAAEAAAAPWYDGCFDDAGSRFGIAPQLLRAIATQESAFNPDAINRNWDDTLDIGVMQINTQWLAKLETYGITEDDLWEPCFNIHVGAWVLAGNIASYGYNWDAVGAYNAGTARTPKAVRQRELYAHKIATHLGRRGNPDRLHVDAHGQTH